MNNSVEKVKMAMLSIQRYPWEQGVCMQAIYESGDIKTAIAMAHDAVLRQTDDGRLAVINDNIAVTDPAANGCIVKYAYDITKDDFYLTGAKRMLDYLLYKAPRTSNNTLCHNEISFHEGYSANQIWADSIYMAPPFLATMGYLDEAFNQINNMIDYLLDESTGLLRHIYDASLNKFVRDKIWATGNGWALLGCASVIDIAIKENRLDIADCLSATANKLLYNMLKYQLHDGRFHDILNEQDSFIDGTSAMMMSAYIYRSIINHTLDISYCKYADKVTETIENYIDDYGIIHEVCGCPHFLSSGTSAESMAAYIMMHSWKDKCCI